MSKSLVLSGVQPTGNLHLGNYLGAIRNWVSMQKEYDCLFCIVDLHAITVPQNPKELHENILNTAATYIACGIDPKKSAIFNQSTVSAHSELAWILGCSTPLGWLNRMTQFKEKRKVDATEQVKKINYVLELIKSDSQHQDIDINTHHIKLFNDAIQSELESLSQSNLGLFSYPVLMAADILIYKATHVPVGHDQKQHLELARDIAGAFNRQYKEYFPLPEPMILGEATRVMSLQDGTKKMSKSDESEYTRVNLTDDADTIRKKFQKAKSDSTRGFETIEGRPEAENLLTIYAALSGTTLKKAHEKFKSADFGGLKKELAELAVEKLSPISSEIKKLMDDKAHLKKILKDGSEKANAIAEKNMKEIKEIVGFLIP